MSFLRRTGAASPPGDRAQPALDYTPPTPTSPPPHPTPPSPGCLQTAIDSVKAAEASGELAQRLTDLGFTLVPGSLA